MLRDLKLALRLAARRPLLSSAIVATLALGIGATTATLSVVRAVLLEPLPVRAQDRLAIIWETDVTRGVPFVEVSYPDFVDWQRQAEVFDGLAAMSAVNMAPTLTGFGEPRRLPGRPVSASFFEVLGSAPALGRALHASDNRAGAEKVAVISDGVWRTLFGADPTAIGKRLTLDAEPHTIVGIMPAGFDYPDGAEFWTPIVTSVPSAAGEGRHVGWLLVVSRLKPGVTLEQARTALDAIVMQLDRQHWSKTDRRVVLQPLADQVLGRIRRPLLALAAAALLVLLLGCVNIAGLLLARAVERRREMALRTALGGSPARLARQIFLETLPLAVAGGALGLAVANGLLAFFSSARGLELPRPVELSIDPAAMTIAVVLSIGAAAFCCTAAALDAAIARRRAIVDRLKPSPGAGDTPRQRRARDGLVVAEMALALVLLGGAMLVGRSFLALSRADIGYDASRLLTLEVPPRAEELAQARLFYDRLVERVRALPGVDAAAGVFLRPLWGTIGFDFPYTLEGQTPAEAQANPFVNFEGVTPGYFETMGARLVAGRDFTAQDDERAAGAVIVSESFARRAWPGTSALGRRLKVPLPGSPLDKQWLIVVGVAADMRYREIEHARLDLYMSHGQFPSTLKHLVVKADGDPATLAASVRAAIRAMDPAQHVDDVRTMGSIVDAALRTRRVSAQIFVALAAAALLLALLGVHAMMAHAVTLVRRELAVRLALGAEPGRVRREILGRGVRLALAALVPGLAASVVVGRSVASLLYGVAPTDLPTLGAAAAVIAAVGLAGCYLPALRASRTDPIAALRHE
ncbi:MAG: ABC transporter permease [Vicinamibacterales bacterium]